MVAVPAATAVTIPVPLPTVATETLLLVQVPPEVASVYREEVPAQSGEAPVIDPLVGVSVTVTASVLNALPQDEETE